MLVFDGSVLEVIDFVERIQGTFADLLNSLVRGSGFSKLAVAVEDMKRSGISISYSTVAAYSRLDSCPSIDKAKAILDYFNFEIEDDQLEDLLRRTRAEIKKTGSDDRYITAGIRIPVDRFESDKALLELRINRRAEELLGKSASLNSYIVELIRRDLEA